MEIMYYFNLLQGRKICGISLPYLSNWLYLSGRAALQKRIMALLRQLDRQTAGNVQVYVSIFHIFYLYYNCFHFIWTLPLADQVMVLNLRTKSCHVTCQTNSLEMSVFTATSHCTDSIAYQFSYRKITLKGKQNRSRANGCFHGFLSYLDIKSLKISILVRFGQI